MDELTREVARRIDAADPTLRRIGTHAEARAFIEGLADRTWHSLWTAQRVMTFSVGMAGAPLDELSRARGVVIRPVYPLGQVLAHPLATTIDPNLRVAPTSVSLMVADAREVLVTDPRIVEDPPASYTSTDPALADLAVRAMAELWHRATPWEETDALPPLSPRRYAVAVNLARGRTDREIATELGVGERTVWADVRAIVRWCHARNRAHAVAKIVGAG